MKALRGISVILACLIVISAELLGVAYFVGTVDTHVRLPLIALVGVISLIAILSCVSITFSTIDLSDRKQALGLPEGSIRAVIATHPSRSARRRS